MGDGGRPGRPESPLNPEEGAVARLAAQLRQLREDAGRPSYRQLARTAFYSHSALSQAAAGRELPSLAVTLAFAEACGGDRQEWIARWEEAAAAAGASAAAGPSAAAPGGPAGGIDPAAPGRPDIGARPDRIRRALWRPLTIAGLAAVVAAGLLEAGFSLGWLAPHVTRQPVGGLGAPVFDGASPDVGGCYIGSGDLGTSPIRAGNGAALGTVELRYSRHCAAVWARFDPGPAMSGAGAVTITVTILRQLDGKTEVARVRYAGKRQRSDLLLLHAGCAQASVVITKAGRVLADSATACRTAP
jgi:hypothetical protein